MSKFICHRWLFHCDTCRLSLYNHYSSKNAKIWISRSLAYYRTAKLWIFPLIKSYIWPCLHWYLNINSFIQSVWKLHACFIMDRTHFCNSQWTMKCFYIPSRSWWSPWAWLFFFFFFLSRSRNTLTRPDFYS